MREGEKEWEEIFRIRVFFFDFNFFFFSWFPHINNVFLSSVSYIITTFAHGNTANLNLMYFMYFMYSICFICFHLLHVEKENYERMKCAFAGMHFDKMFSI